MTQLRCAVFRGLATELEEQVNKFLESSSCQVHFVLQSETGDDITLTLIYKADSRASDDRKSAGLGTRDGHHETRHAAGSLSRSGRGLPHPA